MSSIRCSIAVGLSLWNIHTADGSLNGPQVSTSMISINYWVFVINERVVIYS